MSASKTAIRFGLFGHCLALLVVTAFTNNLTAADIAWTNDPQHAVDVAHQSGRMILVSVGADWCHFCKKMERESWTDRSVAAIVARSYVPLRLQDEQHAELIRALGVHAFPTTLVFTADRRLVARVEGYVDASKLASLLDRAYVAARNGTPLESF
ncbi:MAG: thioredoxin family protein [Planctomycetota bacterium]|nr:MAG: thioredoxin family protein [Planctomycetota bacterium]